MPKISPRLKTLDDLFAMNQEDQPVLEQPKSQNNPVSATVITLLPPNLIRPHPKHPFHLYEGERLDDLVVSIRANGILIPVIVHKIERDEDGYEYVMLAGHNRQNGAILAELAQIPCIVKENLSEEEEWIYIIETNVLQRSFAELLPSEKAAVLAFRYSKMFSQGKRNDIIEELKMLENPQYIKENSTCGNECHKLKSRDVLGREYDLQGRSVANYLRINELIDPLKKRIDRDELIIAAAAGLSYLSSPEQQMVEAVLSEHEYKVNLPKVALLRSYTGRLDAGLTEQILSGEKTKKAKNSAPQPFKLKAKIYTKYFRPETKAAEMEQIIDAALSMYFSQCQQKGA